MVDLPDLFSREGEREGLTKVNCIGHDHEPCQDEPARQAKIESIGALALYFFSRRHLDGGPFPDTSRPQNWSKIHVLKGQGRKAEESSTIRR